jgi:hypothetical protein
MTAILPNTIFKQLQMLFEFLMLFTLLLMLLRYSSSKNEIFTIVIVIATLIFSFFYLPLSASLLNLKNLLLGLFSALFFSRYRLNSSVMKWFLRILVCISVFVVFENYASMFYAIAKNGELLEKPFGIFLNYHFHAFITALILLGLSNSIRVFIFSIFILIMGQVLTPLISFLLAILYRLSSRKKYFLNIILCVLIICFFIIFININDNRDYLENLLVNLNRSLYVLAVQLFNTESYIDSFRLLPGDINQYYTTNEYTYDLIEKIISNEIGFKAILYQGGLLYFLLLYFLIFKFYKIFFVFILLTSLHYPYLFNPLTYLIMGYFSLEKNNLLNKKNYNYRKKSPDKLQRARL